ncbi:MAG TPA: Rieske 2Fe-2S domain-containing protein, partial [Dermatophilaceae bacterium]|nr:Rieske 2Fe-2S domain-containing protein [Dermatophilaceae bacterium]
SALISGEADPELANIYDPARLHPLVEAIPAGKAQLRVARHFIGDRIRPPSHADSIADIAPGSGAIVRVNGQRCAVHRAEDDTIHAVSAVCTHLGCLVAFNDAEQAWECPCHGSRLTVRHRRHGAPRACHQEPQAA